MEKIKTILKSWLRSIVVALGYLAIYVVLYYAGMISESIMQRGIRVFRIIIVGSFLGSIIVHTLLKPRIKTQPGEHINWNYDPEASSKDDCGGTQ